METKKNELPAQCKIDNFLWGCSVIWNIIFIPIFIFNITKGNHSNKRIVMPTKLSYFKPAGKLTCASLEFNSLWQYGIPTHTLSMFWRFEDDILGLEVDILVPETQSFIADVHLRQWANELQFIVTSAPLYNGENCSMKYQNKMYKPKPYVAKNKSVDMAVGNALFGKNIVKYKSAKLGKTYE